MYISDNPFVNDKRLQVALWAKEQELLALAKKHEERANGAPVEVVWYWDGKAIAFADAWIMLLAGTTDVYPQLYNEWNEMWSRRATESLNEKGIVLK